MDSPSSSPRRSDNEVSYLVPLSWWNEAEGNIPVAGAEILFDVKKKGDTEGSFRLAEKMALVPELEFWRAFKWHNDRKTPAPDFFSLKTVATGALGLVGLANVGNTCFMNSAIQSLVHTSELVDFFLGDFPREINSDNHLGSKGKIALEFGTLLRKLWRPGVRSVSPAILKDVISSKDSTYKKNNQHDAQEFLSFLKGQLHEDLNRVKIKPCIKQIDNDYRLDEEVADEYWQNHQLHNDSIIMDLFEGQERSQLVCNDCNKSSVKFSHFLILPLPLARITEMTVAIICSDGLLSLSVSVPEHGLLKDLNDALCKSCSLKEDESLLLAQVHESNIVKFLDNLSSSIQGINKEDKIVAYRLPKDSEESLLIVFTHEFEDDKRCGFPLMSRVSKCFDVDIRQELLRLLKPYLTMESAGSFDVDIQHDGDFCRPMDRVLPLVFIWPKGMADDYTLFFSKDLPQVVCSSIPLISLNECLDNYFKDESLENPWYCPSCKDKRQANKKLDLWRLPEILVIHLKRFSNLQSNTKLETFVQFPTADFDLSRFIAPSQRQNPCRYSLYGVINHYGGMDFGHYTSCVQVQGRWYTFSDAVVTAATEKSVVSSSAYILFYKKNTVQ